MRDPLVSVYTALEKAIKTVHGSSFLVTNDTPNPIETKKRVLPAANITYVSGTSEKALMREHEPHGVLSNGNGTFTVGTEAVRFHYLIQVSFFAERPSQAQQLSTKFLAYIETENEIGIPEDKWGDLVQIFIASPPLPPRGEPNLYQVDATYQCLGQLIVEEQVNAIDVSKFKPKVG
ncbi:hypothetical protein P4V47_08900 [Brevibacillus laterosporus]|uniref:hypothetical protein n=1 Tax=Brevibacillus laterosporus TaxID=1465 RepID=UPI002E233242|nr:hypothetical protein [Brevibacillus laterosporus]